ncbi:hypothetical protein NE686_17460 [Tissierella carlieri]|uniref:Uncharacterized protein n=1 Tax=Tissierella carlieri TaxID=689904 RepID=A0ABT1SEI0_9FIRM|nr:hypothetical protein [Tissierella carlieri]MCQ4924893.1 hypothetical protein [Tissierella carlieri]
MDKKAFQKFVKKFRNEGDEFPKAMMYGSQMRKRQATINCGSTTKSNEIVDKIIDSGLDEFLESQNARGYEVEKSLNQRSQVISQIRIYY